MATSGVHRNQKISAGKTQNCSLSKERKRGRIHQFVDTRFSEILKSSGGSRMLRVPRFLSNENSSCSEMSVQQIE